jgi:ABC-type uncharacterized transport system permease subunit
MSLLWLKVAVFLYGLAALAVLPAALYNRLGWRHIAVPATATAILFHFVSLMEMLNAAHHRVPVEIHEFQSLFALLLSVGFLAVYFRFRTVAIGIFVLPAAFLLGVLAAFRPGLNQSQILPLRAGWIFVHVALIFAAYAALVVSLLASLLYLIQERRLKAKAPSLTFLPPLETADQIALKSLLFGLPCMTAGLLIGSWVAQQTVGAGYFLDPKILLAFAMWFAYCLMIFIRRHSGLRGRRAIYLSSFVFLVVLGVWAANQFSAVHRFTAP